jgi:membrane-bound serine protease (ClpP class)
MYLFGLLALGFLLVGLELFLPGGITGAMGGLCLLVGMVLVFRTYGAATGVLVLGICMGIGRILGVWGWRRLRKSSGILTTRLGTESTSGKREKMKGKVGKTRTDLNPSGIVTIEGQSLEAIAEGAYIPRDTPIHVVDAEARWMHVRALPEPD